MPRTENNVALLNANGGRKLLLSTDDLWFVLKILEAYPPEAMSDEELRRHERITSFIAPYAFPRGDVCPNEHG